MGAGLNGIKLRHFVGGKGSVVNADVINYVVKGFCLPSKVSANPLSSETGVPVCWERVGNASIKGSVYEEIFRKSVIGCHKSRPSVGGYQYACEKIIILVR